MNELSNLMLGFEAILNYKVLFWCILGVTLGTLIGALPGMGSVTGIAILLPLTFELDVISSLVLLTGIYQGGMYGGRISAILINVPGDASAVATTFDGYPMATQGKAGYALSLSALASFIGGTIGLLGLVFLTPIVGDFALNFGPPEYFTLMLLALIITGGLGSTSMLKSFIIISLGLLISMIGRDIVTSENRFTFGLIELWDGVSFVIVAIGIFGISEVLIGLDKIEEKKVMQKKLPLKELFPTVRQLKNNLGSTLRGGIVGFVIGVLPGAGATIASFFSYSVEKNISKTPELFGKGIDQGLSGVESSNNSAMAGALVPLFTLGIPGSGSTAIILGALIMLGLQPGPSMLQTSGNIIWAVIAALILANLLLLILNTLFVPIFTNLIRYAEKYMISIITILCIFGVYFLNNSLFDVWLMIIFGVLGYLLRKFDFSLAGLLLAVVLGGMIEINFRQSLLMSGSSSYLIFIERPIALVFLIIIVVFILHNLIKNIKRASLKKRENYNNL